MTLGSCELRQSQRLNSRSSTLALLRKGMSAPMSRGKGACSTTVATSPTTSVNRLPWSRHALSAGPIPSARRATQPRPLEEFLPWLAAFSPGPHHCGGSFSPASSNHSLLQETARATVAAQSLSEPSDSCPRRLARPHRQRDALRQPRETHHERVPLRQAEVCGHLANLSAKECALGDALGRRSCTRVSGKRRGRSDCSSEVITKSS